MSSSVRRLVRTAYGKAGSQRAIVEKCITSAQELARKPGSKTASSSLSSSASSSSSAGGSASSSSTTSSSSSNGSSSSGGSSKQMYAEVTNHEEYQAANIQSMGSLSGVAVSVSDALDVKGFRTRFGMSSSLFHSAPTEESAFIDWIRRRGATVVGKLKCQTPMSWEDGAQISRDDPAYEVVQRGASHFAITTTVLGAPAVTAPYYHHDTIGFKPTAMSLDTRMVGRHSPSTVLASRQSAASLGIVAKNIDDIKYLWDVYTGAIQSESVLESIKEAERRDKERQGNAQQDTSSSRLQNFSDNPLREEHDAFLDRMVRVQGNKGGQPVALTVGFPADWIEKYFSDQFDNGDDFEYALQRIINKSLKDLDKAHRNVTVDIVALPFTSIDIEGSLRAQKVIAEYELARAFELQNDGKGVPSGMMDELPTAVVTALFNGRHTTEEQYLAASRLREDIVREIDGQFRDVDVICCPIVGDPYQSGNIRSVLSTVPFALAGNPIVSARVSDTIALQLVGEMGRDTGLLEDATSLLRFMGKGRAPRWWRKKFFGEED